MSHRYNAGNHAFLAAQARMHQEMRAKEHARSLRPIAIAYRLIAWSVWLIAGVALFFYLAIDGR